MPTQINYTTQIQNLPEIDIRSYGAKEGTNCTTAIQAAMDAVGIAAPAPCLVRVPRGKWYLSTALKFKRDGIILAGYGAMGEGGSDNIPSMLVASDSVATHDNTPLIQIDPNDRSGGAAQWYRGTAIRDLSFDVNASARFNTGATPPIVLSMIGMSNCPSFDNLVFWGFTGTAIYIGVNTTAGAISENLVFNNILLYGGYLANGGTYNNEVPKGAGIIISGADNVQFNGGLVAYAYSTTHGGSTPANLPVNNNLTDMPGVLIVGQALVGGFGGFNIINNGCVLNGTIFTNYVVGIRLSMLQFGGIWYGPQGCRFTNLAMERYNKAFQINQESTSSVSSFFYSRVYISGLAIGDGFGSAIGTDIFKLQGNNMQAGQIDIPYLGAQSDLYLGANTNGITYRIGPNPNGTFFSATDLGTNCGKYSKPALMGQIVTGQHRFMAGVDPVNANSGTGTQGIQNYGNTLRAFYNPGAPGTAVGRNIATSGASGVNGDFTVGFDPGTSKWYIFVCVVDNIWGRVALDFSF